MKYEDLTEDAKETIKGMIHYCINNCVGMGMDEGLNSDDTKKPFRKELEEFSEYGSNSC